MRRIKRFILLTLLILTCTGCTIEYNINITEDNIEEVIKVNDYITSTRIKEDILKEYNNWYPTYVNFIGDKESIEIEDYSTKTEGVEYHKKDIKSIDDGYNYTYNYIYPINKYYDAYTLARAYTETTVYYGNHTLVLKTGKENLLCQYDYFDSVKVNITIDPEIYKLNYTNTSTIRNNTYTWTLDRNNCNNSQIILTLDTIEKDEDIVNNQTDNNQTNNKDYSIYIFCGILILLIIIGYQIYKKIKEKNENFDIDD